MLLEMAGVPSFYDRVIFRIVCEYLIFFIYSSINRRFGCFHTLATVNNAVMSLGHRNLFEIMISIPLNTSLEVELLSQKAVLFLIF